MIHVIATIKVCPGARESFLREFEALKAEVMREDGCIEYGAATGLDLDLPQGGDYAWAPAVSNAVVIIEKWSSMETWKAHLTAPHMVTYRARTKDLVTARNVQVLAPVTVAVAPSAVLGSR
jgi:quinol monooxygenase YgiN